MFPIRRAAWRFFTSPSTSLAVRARTVSSLSQSPLRVQKQISSPLYQRRWASDEAKKDDPPISQLQPTPQEEVENAIQEENAAQTIDSSIETPSEAVESPMEAAPATTDTTNHTTTADEAELQESPADTAQDAVASTTAATGEMASSAAANQASTKQSSRHHTTASGDKIEPKATVYIGNLFFDVTEDDLTKELARYGKIERLRLIRDARGLSKGFGYATFSDVETATKVVDELNSQLFEGRRLTVGYAAHDSPPRVRRDNFEKPISPPSKTLFIGNMSWEMTDRDLNNLFRGIKNVIDVRVAIDRRTGQPRGFAHADFTDVKSAMEAMKALNGKETYGRKLRIDYSFGSSGAPRNEAKDRGEL